jgi:hypothetical protein
MDCTIIDEYLKGHDNKWRCPKKKTKVEAAADNSAADKEWFSSTA